MHMSRKILLDLRKTTPLRKIARSICVIEFVSQRARMPGKFNLKKDSHPMKTERRPRILVRLSFRELCDSNLFDSRAFDDMAISMSQEGDKKRKGRL